MVRYLKMRLYIIFTLIDVLIILAYPILYVVQLVRKMINSKQ